MMLALQHWWAIATPAEYLTLASAIFGAAGTVFLYVGSYTLEPLSGGGFFPRRWLITTTGFVRATGAERGHNDPVFCCCCSRSSPRAPRSF